MIRDKVKTATYFDEWIHYDQDVIQQIRDELESGSLSPYGKVQAAYDLAKKILGRGIMRYSRGDRLADVRDDLESLLAVREQLKVLCDALPSSEQKNRFQYEQLSFDNYLDFFWWLSLAACLGMGEVHLGRVIALIGNVGHDALLDRIAVKLGDRQRAVSSDLVFPKQYALLLQALDAPSPEQPGLIRKFLDGWYKGNRNVAAWYDSHKGEDTGYVGYWSLEAALV
ncbi:DUF1911 domain-containing protein, partial [Luteimonas sp. Y-2-2-4F]